MADKVCGVCGKKKPFTNEYFSAYTTASGNPSRRGTCKICMSERAKRHHKERPDLRQAALDSRKKRAQKAEGRYTKSDVEALKASLKNSCFYCGTSTVGALTIDHMRPLSRGGTNWPMNLTLACKPCNFDKHGKTALEFVTWRRLHKLHCSPRALKLLGKDRRIGTA